MGALLSLPLMAVPSVGTVCDPIHRHQESWSPANERLISRSWLVWLHAAELRHVQPFVGPVGNFRAGMVGYSLLMSTHQADGFGIVWRRELLTL